MIFNGKEVEDYSPTELLDFCRVDALPFDGPGQIVSDIMAAVIVSREAEDLKERLREIVIRITKVSIGRALARLHTVATMPDEFLGGLDGLSALTYHLSESTCKMAITDLHAVLARFDKDEKASSNLLAPLIFKKNNRISPFVLL